MHLLPGRHHKEPPERQPAYRVRLRLKTMLGQEVVTQLEVNNMEEEYTIKYVLGENEQNGIIQLYEHEEDVEVVLKIKGAIIEKRADNYFEALNKIRMELEKKEIKLLCKGCCRNVYPSGMLLDMGSGRKAYQLVMGEQAKMSSLVDIFESCKIEDYVSLNEQHDFFEEWCNSITEK